MPNIIPISIEMKIKLTMLFSGGLDEPGLHALIQSAGEDMLPGIGDFLLHEAVNHSACELIPLILRAGVNVNGYDPETTPLKVAARLGRTEVVSTLIGAGADVNLCSPLEGAVALLRTNCARLLLAAGANPVEALKQAALIQTNDTLGVEHFLPTLPERLAMLGEFLRLDIVHSWPNLNLPEIALLIVQDMKVYQSPIHRVNELQLLDGVRFYILRLFYPYLRGNQDFIIPLAQKNLLFMMGLIFSRIPEENRLSVITALLTASNVSSCLLQEFMDRYGEAIVGKINPVTVDLRFYIYDTALRKQLKEYKQQIAAYLQEKQLDALEICLAVLRSEHNHCETFINIYYILTYLNLDLKFKTEQKENFLHLVGRVYCKALLNGAGEEVLTRMEDFIVSLCKRGVDPFERDAVRVEPVGHLMPQAIGFPRVLSLYSRMKAGYQHYLAEQRFINEVLNLVRIVFFRGTPKTELAKLFNLLPIDVVYLLAEQIGKDLWHRQPKEISLKVHTIFSCAKATVLQRGNEKPKDLTPIV